MWIIICNQWSNLITSTSLFPITSLSRLHVICYYLSTRRCNANDNKTLICRLNSITKRLDVGLNLPTCWKYKTSMTKLSVSHPIKCISWYWLTFHSLIKVGFEYWPGHQFIFVWLQFNIWCSSLTSFYTAWVWPGGVNTINTSIQSFTIWNAKGFLFL